MIYPILINKRLSPYRSLSNDIIQSNVKVYNKNRLINISGLAIELWMNYNSGVWQKVEDSSTNRYGIQTIYHACSGIENINCCLGYSKVTYNDVVYTSNTVRYNFIGNIDYVGYFIIDAGTDEEQITPLDRSLYDEFTAGEDISDRSEYDVYDRMYS